MFPRKFVEKIKTHILCSETFLSKIVSFPEIMWKNIVESGRPRDNMAHAHKAVQEQKLGICNTYCFPTITTVARTRLNVTLYVHYLYCSYLNSLLVS